LCKVNILVLVSGGGTNLQALLDAQARGEFEGAVIAAVLSDRDGAYALERAKASGVPAFTEKPDPRLSRPERRLELSNRILSFCRKKQIGLIVHAGFLSILAGDIIEAYSGKMINIHPSLLPKFGGQGMYGEHVHQAVLAAGETESGCTVHIVDAGTDTGAALLQRRVQVLPGDSTKSLAERILKEEHIAIVEGVKMMTQRLQ
jgi:phosphoribosylglycinamide formyltransferase-1